MVAETTFSSIKHVCLRGYVSATRFQIGKRGDDEGIFVQSVYKNDIR